MQWSASAVFVGGWFGLLAIVVGVAAGVTTPGVTVAAGAAVAIATLSTAMLVDSVRMRRVLLVAACAAGAAAHAAHTRNRVLAAPAAVLAHVPDTGAAVHLEGRLASDAVRTDAGAQLEIRLSALSANGRRVETGGRVRAHVAGQHVDAHVSEWRAGRPIRAPATIRAPVWLHNPGGPSPRWQALARGIDAVASIKSAAVVDVDRGRVWNEAAAAVRAHVRVVAARYIAPRHAQSAAIVTAVLIGDRAAIDDEVTARLQAAGTYHVIAISGGNVALVAGLVWLTVRLLVRGHRPGTMAALGGVLAYGFVVGGDASVTRAVAVAAVYLALAAAGLTTSLLRVVTVVAAGTLLVDPLTVVDVGAWLSYGATVGIVVCAPRIVRRVLEVTDRYGTLAGGTRAAPPGLAHRAGRWSARFARAALALLAATIAAELALLPLAVGTFGRVGLAGLALNFVAIPAMAVVQMAGLGTTVLVAVSTVAASWAGAIADLAARLLVGSARLVDLLPWLSWRVPASEPVWTVLYYLAGVVALVGPPGSWRRQGAACLWLCSLVVLVTAAFSARAAPSAGRLRLTMIDVGQGDAMLLQLPGGAAMLVDGGGVAGRFDIGDRVVTRAIWALGVRRLDWVVMTHPDLDHARGLSSVVRALRPREIWEGVPVAMADEWRALREAAAVRGASWRAVQAGDHLEVGPVEVLVAHPPLPDWERRRTRNDDSIVLRIRYGEVEFVLPGDIGSAVEAGLAEPRERARVRVLKVAHHGSRSSTSAAWLGRAQPQLALVSAGRDNLFGHPSRQVLDRLRGLGVEVFRTDLDGAVSVETDGREVSVRAMSGRTWGLQPWR